MEIKLRNITKDDVVSGDSVLFSHNFKTVMSLWHKHHDANEVGTFDWGDSEGSDRPISAEGIQVDEDIFCVISWASGFGVYRLNDDGSVSNLYHDRYPLNGYAYYQSIAIDRVSKVAYVGSHNTQGIARYDYSDCFGGLDVVNKLTEWKEVDGLFGDEFGHSYVNGLTIAGRYVYYGTDDKGANAQYRFNSETGVFDSVAVQNTSGSYNRYGGMYYNPDSDRVYNHSYYDGELIITTNASSADAKSFAILYDDIPGIDNDAYIHIVCEDPLDPNKIWCGSGYQLFRLDVSACVVDGVTNGTVPTLISDGYKHRETDFRTFTNMRFGWSTPDKGDFIYVLGDRGWNRQGGWLDQENFNVVSVSRVNGNLIYRPKDYLYIDYGAMPRLITSAGGTKYWLVGGYGWDGYKFRTYAEGNAVYLDTSGSIEFSGIQLDNTNNIDSVEMPAIDDDFFIPSGCSASILVSNDNGSTWETYGRTGRHVFSSTGNTFKLKILFNGSGKASPYLLSHEKLQAVLIERTSVPNAPFSTKFKLAGGN